MKNSSLTMLNIYLCTSTNQQWPPCNYKPTYGKDFQADFQEFYKYTFRKEHPLHRMGPGHGGIKVKTIYFSMVRVGKVLE